MPLATIAERAEAAIGLRATCPLLPIKRDWTRETDGKPLQPHGPPRSSTLKVGGGGLSPYWERRFRL